MKGVILAGGSGTRLLPSTKVTNKHLLPVYNKPMIYYPIETMLKAGITDILILPGKDHAGAFAQLFGSGSDFNARFTYRVQDAAGGLAFAVGLAEPFVGDDDFMVLLGDNIILDDLSETVKNFKGGAHIFLTQVPDPERSGIAELDGTRVKRIIEKPANPPSNWAVIGAYIYDSKAFEYIRGLKPSGRGEVEITDLNNKYIEEGGVQASFLKEPWFDAGTNESLVDAAAAIRARNQPADKIKAHISLSPLIAAGFLLHESRKYLPRFLESVKRQDYRNIKLYALDNNANADSEDVVYIRTHYPDVTIQRVTYNTGFAKGHNYLIRQALQDKAEFYVALNCDVELESNVISEIVGSMLKDLKVAAATGKLKKWNFALADTDGKTNFIDSAGLAISREHRFTNRGEGEIDHGQYDKEEEVFGVSGTAGMYRISALEDVAFLNERGEREYFDELMFMYKEDVDLAYRLQWAGWKALYVPRAVAYHDRTLAASGTGNGLVGIIRGRIGRNKQTKAWSWLNHHIILSKYINSDYSSDVLAATTWYEVKSFVYILFAEPYLLREFFTFLKLRRHIAERRQQLKRRQGNYSLIEKWMMG